MTSIRVLIDSQMLELWRDNRLLESYPVSTAANGPGELAGTACTPRGSHIIRAKIGAGAAEGAVFVGRRQTGEVWTPELAAAHPERDWILTRILWLSGCLPGFNRLGERDTMRRYIYIHGTHDQANLGSAVSHGCIRMGNRDIIRLFDQVECGTRVDIVASSAGEPVRNDLAEAQSIRP
jgi:lipoprotein-anchoring transpeptidase ErfK/SrfK